MKNNGRWFVIGIFVVALLGFTTDQIMNNVYDATNTALRANIVNGSGTPISVATATPLAFGTPGVIPIFAATELGAYAGSSTCSAGSMAVSISAAGAVTCATPVAVATATPELPPVAFSYSGKLTVTGNTAISASATPAAQDRNIYCTSGSSTDKTYTMPPATATGRVVDVWKVDSGSKACILGRAGSDTLNGATTLTLSAQYGHETCIDQASTVWLCTGSGT